MDPLTKPAIRHRIEDGLGWIIIDNPRRANALTLDMMGVLGELVATMEADQSVRAVVIAGAGGRAFSSGGDFSEFNRNRSTEGGTEAYRQRFRGAVAVLAGASKPTIAAIEGHCIGGGMTIALACDLRYAAEDARFHLPSAAIGNGFDYGSIERLTALVGPAHAKEMFLTAGHAGGAEAARIGLVNRCLPKDGFMDAVAAIAGEIAANAPLSIAALKRAVDAAAIHTTGSGLKPVLDAFDHCAASEDHKEGRLAKAEKRKPVFRGR